MKSKHTSWLALIELSGSKPVIVTFEKQKHDKYR